MGGEVTLMTMEVERLRVVVAVEAGGMSRETALLQEKLVTDAGLTLSIERVRQLLIEAGL